MNHSEFDQYFKNLIQKAERINPITGECRKAGFQGTVMGLLSCDEEHTFTGEQVWQIFDMLLNYKNEPYGTPPKKALIKR